MANLTRMKILTTGNTTTQPSLKTGELAYSYEQTAKGQGQLGERLFIGTGTEVGGVATSVDIIGGKYFTNLLSHVHGTNTANAALITDVNKHVDQLNTAQLKVAGSGSLAGAVGITSILDEDTFASDSATALATQQSIKAYVDAQVTAQDLDFAGDTGTGAVDLDAQIFTVSGTTNEIETNATGQTITIGLPNNVTIGNNLTVTNVLQVNGNTILGDNPADTVETTGSLTVGGNLTVNGTLTTVNSSTVTVDDIILTLGGDTAPTADDNLDRGIEYRYFDGTAKVGFFGFDDSTGRFVFVPDANTAGGTVTGALGDLDAGGAYIGNIQVGITGDNEIDTSSGDLTLDSATGNVNVTGALSASSLSLTTDLAVTHGGTGLSSFTGDGVFVSNTAGTAINFLTGAQGDVIQFDAAGAPIASNIIDGGTY